MIAPNLPDYESFGRSFSWQAERAELDGLPGNRGLNIAHEAVDRHAGGALAGTVALRWSAKMTVCRILRIWICTGSLPDLPMYWSI